ncbi:hypothetical protein [Paracoccus aminophilus]|uniref:hypothetical protein n=1 Tax=Paracoccus aminophilus TaxID=34003 RepID=UPI000423ECF7|nr:hypothetical protein [Paracoccus aminophilus]
MYRVILLTLIGLFIVVALANAPEFNRERVMTPASTPTLSSYGFSASDNPNHANMHILRVSSEK